MDKEINNIAKKYWPLIYGKKSNIYQSKICQSCRSYFKSKKQITSLQPLPYVGSKFHSPINEYKIMFIGKGTWGNNDCEGFDIFTDNDLVDLYYDSKYSFWMWIRDITKKVYEKDEPQDVFPYIAYSNVHKCQAYPKTCTSDQTDYRIYKQLSINCIQKVGWIYHEIRELNPKNVILFLGYSKDCFLYKLFLQNKIDYQNFYYSKYDLYKSKFEKGHIIQLRDGNRRFILTNHPQGTPNPEILKKKISRIIRDNTWDKAINWKMPN